MHDGGDPLSFNFPNFEMCEHWGEQIRFLGPVWFQDTLLFEQRHLSAKTMCQRTNQQANERDILIKVQTLPFDIKHRLILSFRTQPDA